MFKITKTFTHEMGFRITPIEMQGVGYVFLPKELENQLGYEDISNTIRHSESFAEGIEYIILTDSNLQLFKELLNYGNTITAVAPSSSLKHSRSLTVLTESGLYNLLALSRKPDIQEFRRWATVDVLPGLRLQDVQLPEKFNLTKTFTNDLGFHVTPIEMQGVGFIFLSQEVEKQLGYEDLAKLVIQSESFSEGIEYTVLKNSNLMYLKELLNRVHSMESVDKHARALVVLTEPGLYTVAILSRKPGALAFRRWVTGDVLPSIRRTGMYKAPGNFPVRAEKAGSVPELVKRLDSLEQIIGKLAGLLPELLKKVDSLGQTFAQKHTNQEQFQQYALRGFDRIESVLADSLPHDIFEGWWKIKGLVNDMTAMYGLSEAERKQYTRELCRTHDVQLPEKALLESKSLFHDAQEIAVKIGVYSTAKKPHSRLVGALIRHLGLAQEQYCQKFPVARRGYSTTVPKYSDNVVPHILKWLQEKGYPETIEIVCEETGKKWRFRVKYHTCVRGNL